MILHSSLRYINKWVRFFAVWPRPLRSSRTINGVKVEETKLAMLCFLERRVSYAAGVRRGTEYRLPEKVEHINIEPTAEDIREEASS